MNSREQIVKVKFHRPCPDGETEYYFGSVSAIFDVFTEKDIGCGLKSLWAANIDVNRPKISRYCTISRHFVYRKKHKC